jgi:hypothetical protein
MFFISLHAGFALSKTFAALTKQIYSGHFSIVQPTKFKVRYVKMSLLDNRFSLIICQLIPLRYRHKYSPSPSVFSQIFQLLDHPCLTFCSLHIPPCFLLFSFYLY